MNAPAACAAKMVFAEGDPGLDFPWRINNEIHKQINHICLIFPGKLSRETIPDDQKYQMEKQVPLLDGLNTKKNKTPSPPSAPPVPPQPQPLEQRSNIVSEKRKKKGKTKRKMKRKGEAPAPPEA